MAGTAFTLCLEDSGVPFCYLVTAKHCVVNAEDYPGGLHARMNRRNAPGYEIAQLNGSWHFPESEADDVAVMLLPNEIILGCEIAPMTISHWADKTGITIGLGDEVIAIGLFARSSGTERNRPIVRSGIIAALPGVPEIDETTGLPYDAYLIELRSIGGLSGSPVFLVSNFNDNTRILGLIRGHWNKTNVWLPDFDANEQDEINTGIAIVTPIEKAVEVIMKNHDAVTERKRLATAWKRERAPTQDSSLPEVPSSSDEYDRFEELTRRLVQVPKSDIDTDKGRRR